MEMQWQPAQKQKLMAAAGRVVSEAESFQVCTEIVDHLLFPSKVVHDNFAYTCATPPNYSSWKCRTLANSQGSTLTITLWRTFNPVKTVILHPSSFPCWALLTSCTLHRMSAHEHSVALAPFENAPALDFKEDAHHSIWEVRTAVPQVKSVNAEKQNSCKMYKSTAPFQMLSFASCGIKRFGICMQRAC